ncbi:MAG: sugar-binding transcriptional regulator [Chloroflexi bacterium]|nr:sugar-binding transcriptional regulator [Chloroflexota bacterium]
MYDETDQRRILYKIARSYYEDGLTQKQIGKRFGLSRIKVSRMLKQAREQKIVQINLSAPEDGRSDLEHAIEKKCGIDEVITTTPPSYNREGIIRALGPLAAEALVRSIKGDEVIGLTWGSSLLSVVDSLPAEHWPAIRVVQMLGGMSQPDAEINGVDLTRRMAQAFEAKPIILSAPGIVNSPEVRNALINDPAVSKALNMAAAAQIAVVGLGVFSPDSAVLQNEIFTPQEVDRLVAKGAIGDICLQFFNQNGERIEDPIHNRIIGLELPQIKRISRVIGVAGGEEKWIAIRAALRAKLINVLVTDDRTAERLLRN